MTQTWQPSIEGLTLDQLGGAPGRHSGIAGAALATVKALDEAQLLRPQDALTVQLVVELADAIGRGLSFGKVTVATSQLVRQLIDAMDKLPQPLSGDDALTQAWQQFEAMVRDGVPVAS